jgi:hypothetical protein
VRPRHEPSIAAAMPTQQVPRSPILVMANVEGAEQVVQEYQPRYGSSEE